MNRTIFWKQAAVEDLVEVAFRDQKLARRIMILVRRFAIGERVDLKKLSGGEEWRIRTGNWRVLVTLPDDEALIEAVDNRRDAY